MFFFLHVKHRAEFIHNPASYDDPFFYHAVVASRKPYFSSTTSSRRLATIKIRSENIILKQWFRPKCSIWLQHFFRASPQTALSWRSWIRCRLKLLRWSTPWSKLFLVLEIELRDQNCPFHAVCGKILSQTAGGIFERQNSFRRTSLKLSEPNSAFETFNGKSSYVPPESPNTAWLPLRIFFVGNLWYRYGAHIFLWRTINPRSLR